MPPRPLLHPPQQDQQQQQQQHLPNISQHQYQPPRPHQPSQSQMHHSSPPNAPAPARTRLQRSPPITHPLLPAPLRLTTRPPRIEPSTSVSSSSTTAPRPACRPQSVRGTSDYLTVRMANPYTGVVSPSVLGEEDEQEGGGLLGRDLGPNNNDVVPLPLFFGGKRLIGRRDRDTVPVTVIEEEHKDSAGVAADNVGETVSTEKSLVLAGPRPQMQGIRPLGAFTMLGWERPVVQQTPETVDAAIDLKYPDLSPRKKGDAESRSVPTSDLSNYLRYRGKNGHKRPGLKRFIEGGPKEIHTGNSSGQGSETEQGMILAKNGPTEISAGPMLMIEDSVRHSGGENHIRPAGTSVGLLDRGAKQNPSQRTYRIAQQDYNDQGQGHSRPGPGRATLNNTASTRAFGSRGSAANPTERSTSSTYTTSFQPSNQKHSAVENQTSQQRPLSTLERSWSVIGRSWASIAQQARLSNVDLRRLPTIKLRPPSLASVPKGRQSISSPVKAGARETSSSEDASKSSLERGPAFALASFDVMFYRMVASGFSYVTSLFLGSKFMKTLLDASTPPEVRFKQVMLLLSILGRAAVFLVALLCIWHVFNAVFELFRFLLTPFRIIFAPLRFLIRS